MKIVIPAYTADTSKPVDLILDQIRVAIESFYHHRNTWGEFLILTNNRNIERGVESYRYSNSVFFEQEKKIEIRFLDFDKEWKKFGLYINPTKTRSAFIIAKILPVMLMEEDFLLMDYDIMTTGYIDPSVIKSDKIRLFASNRFEGATFRHLSRKYGLTPPSKGGDFRWVNSGYVFLPAGKGQEAVKSYWEKFNSITKKEYRGFYLHHITDDELLYNIMLLDDIADIELVQKHTINCVVTNFYGPFKSENMFGFGDKHPGILNVHFVGNFVKPYNVVVDDSGVLSYKVVVADKFAQNYDGIRWRFDMMDHLACDIHYNALVFSIIWQYYNCRIKENMGIHCREKSSNYEKFFYNSLVPDRK